MNDSSTAMPAGRDLGVRPEHRSSPYQQARLRVGVIGIGCILVTSWLLVGTDTLGRVAGYFAKWEFWGGGMIALVLGLGAALIQLPLDWTGRQIERRFQQSADENGPFVRRYFLGLVGWLTSLFLSGLALGLVVHFAPTNWFALCVLALGLLMLIRQAIFLTPGRAVDLPVESAVWWSTVKYELKKMNLSVPRIQWFDHGEKSLAGGWHGVGRFSTLFIANPVWSVPPRTAAALIAREVGHHQRRDRLVCLLASLAWIFAGLTIARLLFTTSGVPITPAAVVGYTAVVMTNWCFIGLFIWPALGRRQVLAADRFAKDCGLTDTEALQMLQAIADRNLPDENLPPVKAYVFHPIPPMSVRRGAIIARASELTTPQGDV